MYGTHLGVKKQSYFHLMAMGLGLGLFPLRTHLRKGGHTKSAALCLPSTFYFFITWARGARVQSQFLEFLLLPGLGTLIKWDSRLHGPVFVGSFAVVQRRPTCLHQQGGPINPLHAPWWGWGVGGQFSMTRPPTPKTHLPHPHPLT